MDGYESQDNHGREGVLLAAILIGVGVLVSLLAGILHAEGPDPNAHAEVFATYAASSSWTPVHLGQFAGMALIVAGLAGLYWALDDRGGTTLWLRRMGVIAAVVSLGLYGVLQAVDGIALKQAVDAWASAAGDDQASRFASAETVRWTEWAVRSYHSFVFGTSLVLFGAAIASARRVTRPVGYLMALSGLTYVAQGWIVGATGFSSANTVPTLAGIALVVIWSVWLLVDAIRSRSHPAGRRVPRVP